PAGFSFITTVLLSTSRTTPSCPLFPYTTLFRSCFEVKIHSCIYKARPDVQSVVHVHPKFTVVLSVVGSAIRSMCNEGNRLVMDPIPVYPKQKIITTDDEGTEVARLLGSGRVELLYGHGAVTAGR